jgi:3-hydroxyisobutyrate dehydrogenase-like beta-hydroxyacid dehydrogenase
MKYKLILNAIQAAHVIAFGDAMRQAKAVGLDSKVVGENIAIKPGGYPTQMSWNNFQLPPEKTNFSVKWILKDLKYAKAMLEEHRFKAPVSTTILDVSIAVLQKAEDEGHGDEDWTIVNKN